MDFPWIFHGLSMDYPWIFHELQNVSVVIAGTHLGVRKQSRHRHLFARDGVTMSWGCIHPTQTQPNQQKQMSHMGFGRLLTKQKCTEGCATFCPQIAESGHGKRPKTHQRISRFVNTSNSSPILLCCSQKPYTPFPETAKQNRAAQRSIWRCLLCFLTPGGVPETTPETFCNSWTKS